MFRFYRTTVGKKFVVALTGLILVGFVIGHMIGNLKAFMGVGSDGVHHLDHYAHFLRTMGEELLGPMTLLWIVRFGLLASVVLHVATIIQLTMINRAARSSEYKVKKHNSATLASRSMFWGGLLLLVFIVFHILHLTTGDLHFDGFVEGHVYSNVVRAFQHWYLVAFYCAAMIALCAHLYHGIWSLFQSLGLDNPDRNQLIRTGAVLCAFIVALGFVTVPLAVFFGALNEGSAVALLSK